MAIIEKVSAGAERAAKEAEKAIDRGKAKVGELQIEMKMDRQAKRLGYLVYDFSRGREVDQDERQKILDDMAGLEDQLAQLRAEAEAKKQADAEEKARKKAAGAAAGGAAGTWAAEAEGDDPEKASSYPPVPPAEPGCDVPASSSDAARESIEETFRRDEKGAWPSGDA